MQVFGLPGHIIRTGKLASRIAAKSSDNESASRLAAVARWRQAMANGLSAEQAARAVPGLWRMRRDGTRRAAVQACFLHRNAQMIEFFAFISMLLTLYIYVLFAAAIMSWLIAFNVVNPRNQFVAMLGEFLYRITEPVLRPVRNLLPNLGGIDISPVIVILIIVFIQSVIIPNLVRALV